jgi:hypothetical protein
VVGFAFNSTSVTPAGGWKMKSLSGAWIEKTQSESSAMKISRPGNARDTSQQSGTATPAHCPPAKVPTPNHPKLGQKRNGCSGSRRSSMCQLYHPTKCPRRLLSLWIVALQISERTIGSGTLFEKVERLVNTTRYRKADVLLCLFGI